MQIKVPNLGDGIASATVLDVMVAKGDTVEKDQTILELETDKAVAPMPATGSGVIQDIHVKEGDTVSEGTLVLTLEGGSGQSPATASAPTPAAATPSAPAPVASTPAPIPAQSSGQVAATSPYIRKIAAQIGLDLSPIPGTGPSGRMTIDDVRRYIAALQAGQLQPTTQAPSAPKVDPLPDFAKWGSIKRTKVSSLRAKIGDKMKSATQTVPHVTQFDDADITALMAFRKTHNPAYKKKGVNLTLTALSIKVIVDALKEFPIFNTSYDEVNGELIEKNYYHIGVAVDTPNGLIVPVIRDADTKSLFELGKEIAELAEKARDRKLKLEELQGATFTLSNLGGFGVSHFTPIINTPEVGILALGMGRKVPYLADGKLAEKLMMPLGLSYDHRVIDGADGARFMRAIVEGFQQFPESAIKELGK